MKSHEFIIEQTTETVIVLSKDFIEEVHKNCTNYLMNLDIFNPLWRGLANQPTTIEGIKNIRTDRRPRDSGSIPTAAFNYLFEKKFHIPTIRNKVSFATTKYDIAEQYGYPTLIFPSDGTEYITGEKVNDLLGYLDLMLGPSLITKEWMVRFNIDESHYRELLRLFENVNYQSTVKDIERNFGRYIGLWNLYCDEIKDLILRFKLFKSYQPKVNTESEEILLLGPPYYYFYYDQADRDINEARIKGYVVHVDGEEADQYWLNDFNSSVLLECIIQKKEILFVRER